MIELVACTDAHRWLLYDWRNRDEVARYMYEDRPIAREDHDRWYSALLSDRHRWAWVVADDGTPVGAGFLGDHRPEHRRASFGFYLGDTAVRGRGVGTAALAQLCEQAFDVIGLHKLIGEALATNAAAIALYARLGFRTEGVLHDQLRRGGGWVDVRLMALFEHDRAALTSITTALREQGRIA